MLKNLLDFRISVLPFGQFKFVVFSRSLTALVGAKMVDEPGYSLANLAITDRPDHIIIMLNSHLTLPTPPVYSSTPGMGEGE